MAWSFWRARLSRMGFRSGSWPTSSHWGLLVCSTLALAHACTAQKLMFATRRPSFVGLGWGLLDHGPNVLDSVRLVEQSKPPLPNRYCGHKRGSNPTVMHVELDQSRGKKLCRRPPVQHSGAAGCAAPSRVNRLVVIELLV
ncbi:hypothetical protein BGZ61DRAFT_156541 [Ilyonectria robusta]|uniref:uncharacterized protein n=1 Tax=Ilyonectria robusta TaxID=1079257 RepID=UPI001E8CCEE4|nr:uncharacterized protein BGZ61DRAFT_156541 [Ilyonectria robusta]KAH8733275.1 hypothetical protein BGZ61DRAFT_156541 [Ilyonectria robusta]